MRALLIALALCLSIPAAAQRHAVRVNPAAMLLGGTFGLEYEHLVVPHIAIGAELAYHDSRAQLYNPEPAVDEDGDEVVVRGVFVGLRPTVYTGAGLRGAYLSPAFGVVPRAVDGNRYLVGGTAGWSWVAGMVNLRLGAGYGCWIIEGAATGTLLIDLSVGLAF